MYKTSFYNLYIPVEEKKTFLVYKTTTGALAELSKEEGELLLNWTKKGINLNESSNKSFINELKSNGFIVEKDLNEIEQLHDHYLKCHQREYDQSKPPVIGMSIAPTMRCNMMCDYCYAYKKNGEDMDEAMEANVYRILEQIEKINKGELSDPQNGGSFNVAWIGGEPTLMPQVFKNLSIFFQQWAKKKYLEYYSELITNGLLLDDEWIKLLEIGGIKRVQVTIDGNKEKHNSSRPLANTKNCGKNYERILENLSKLPEDINITVRINADKQTINVLEGLLNDLEQYSIWPQRARHVNIDLAPKRPYYSTFSDNISTNENKFADYFKDYAEFYPYRERFRALKLNHYNKWAHDSGKKIMKKRWKLPKGMKSDCGLVNPYVIVICADGYIYKCWEHINKPEFRIQPADKLLDFNNPKYKEWGDYDRFYVFKKCYNCKYIPICDIVTCPALKFVDQESPCCGMKTHLKQTIKEQYIESIDNPELTETISEYCNRLERMNSIKTNENLVLSKI